MTSAREKLEMLVKRMLGKPTQQKNLLLPTSTGLVFLEIKEQGCFLSYSYFLMYEKVL